MSHHEREHDKWDNEITKEEALVLGYTPSKTIAILPSLDGYVECGIGVDEQEAREDFTSKLEDFIKVLQDARVKVMYHEVDLEYTNIRGEV